MYITKHQKIEEHVSLKIQIEKKKVDEKRER